MRHRAPPGVSTRYYCPVILMVWFFFFFNFILAHFTLVCFLSIAFFFFVSSQGFFFIFPSVLFPFLFTLLFFLSLHFFTHIIASVDFFFSLVLNAWLLYVLTFCFYFSYFSYYYWKPSLIKAHFMLCFLSLQINVLQSKRRSEILKSVSIFCYTSIDTCGSLIIL